MKIDYSGATLGDLKYHLARNTKEHREQKAAWDKGLLLDAMAIQRITEECVRKNKNREQKQKQKARQKVFEEAMAVRWVMKKYIDKSVNNEK